MVPVLQTSRQPIPTKIELLEQVGVCPEYPVSESGIMPRISHPHAMALVPTCTTVGLRNLVSRTIGAGEIQGWRDSDESSVSELREVLAGVKLLRSEFASGMFAAHVVAATAVVSRDDDIPALFDRMLSILKTMHDGNPSWGSLFVLHPGNVSLYRAYVRAD